MEIAAFLRVFRTFSLELLLFLRKFVPNIEKTNMKRNKYLGADFVELNLHDFIHTHAITAHILTIKAVGPNIQFARAPVWPP